MVLRTCLTNVPSLPPLKLYLSNLNLLSCTVFLSTYLSPASQCHYVNRLEKKKTLFTHSCLCSLWYCQSMLIQLKLSKATLKLAMAAINWMFILNRKPTLHALTTHLLQDTIPPFLPYVHMPSYRPPLFAFSQRACTAGQ